MLSEWLYFDDEREEIVNRLEQLYFGFLAESKKTNVQTFPRKNGKVEVLPGIPNHRCSNSLESLRAIAKYGILASEWFGEVESEREGVFCYFVDRIHLEENHNSRSEILNFQRLNSKCNRLILFLDDTNLVMRKLLHLDFFEYEKIKQLTPLKMTEIYTSEEIELFDKIIELFSLAGRDMHIGNMLPYCDLSAIPGGISSVLVNGICTNTMTYDENYIEELVKLFPNATIFSGELETIYIPK